MDASTTELIPHPAGEQSLVEELFATADTFGGRVHVEWDPTVPVTPLGQLPFFIDYLKQGGLFDAWVADCPLVLSSPNAPHKRDLLGTLLLSTLAGHYRYAQVTALRCDAVNPPLLGMNKLVSEDSLRRNLARIDETAGLNWLQNHLDYCTAPLLSVPWVLDIDTTAKPLYGHQEGAAVGYNPQNLAARRTVITPTSCLTCGWCCGSMCCPAMNTTLRMQRAACGSCSPISTVIAGPVCCAETSPGASSR
jgi:hypothetical protein